MSRIEQIFKSLEQTERTALISFIMAGDPDYQASLSAMKALPAAGVDLIELGMPFTDPAADGVTIQKAGQRALEAGANMGRTLHMVRDFRADNETTPIILMGYANPVYTYGVEKFAKAAKEAGVDGLIIVDLPPEEDGELREFTSAEGLDLIRLITPTSNEERLKTVLDGASGFLYYVSITGVTGTATADLDVMKPHIEMIRSKSSLPLAIGFGIKTANDAQEMSTLGDAVVVGSSIVDKIKDIGNNGENLDKVTDFVQSISDVLGERLK